MVFDKIKKMTLEGIASYVPTFLKRGAQSALLTGALLLPTYTIAEEIAVASDSNTTNIKATQENNQSRRRRRVPNYTPEPILNRESSNNNGSPLLDNMVRRNWEATLGLNYDNESFSDSLAVRMKPTNGWRASASVRHSAKSDKLLEEALKGTGGEVNRQSFSGAGNVAHKGYLFNRFNTNTSLGGNYSTAYDGMSSDSHSGKVALSVNDTEWGVGVSGYERNRFRETPNRDTHTTETGWKVSLDKEVKDLGVKVDYGETVSDTDQVSGAVGRTQNTSHRQTSKNHLTVNLRTPGGLTTTYSEKVNKRDKGDDTVSQDVRLKLPVTNGGVYLGYGWTGGSVEEYSVRLRLTGNRTWLNAAERNDDSHEGEFADTENGLQDERDARRLTSYGDLFLSLGTDDRTLTETRRLGFQGGLRFGEERSLDFRLSTDIQKSSSSGVSDKENRFYNLGAEYSTGNSSSGFDVKWEDGGDNFGVSVNKRWGF